MFLVGLFFILPSISHATSGACSDHGGVNCSTGPNIDGSVVCNDGWMDSSVKYNDMDECKNINSNNCLNSNYLSVIENACSGLFFNWSGYFSYTLSKNSIDNLNNCYNKWCPKSINNCNYNFNNSIYYPANIVTIDYQYKNNCSKYCESQADNFNAQICAEGGNMACLDYLNSLDATLNKCKDLLAAKSKCPLNSDVDQNGQCFCNYDYQWNLDKSSCIQSNISGLPTSTIQAITRPTITLPKITTKNTASTVSSNKNKYVYFSKKINIRDSASLKGKIIGVSKVKEKYIFKGEKNGWAELNFNGKLGWVLKSLITIK
jgi:hypothetical protein